MHSYSDHVNVQDNINGMYKCHGQRIVSFHWLLSNLGAVSVWLGSPEHQAKNSLDAQCISYSNANPFIYSVVVVNWGLVL